MTRLRAQGVSARYGRTQILFDVTLPDLAEGEILGLLGPNASGKSTLMRCLSREMRAEGLIALDGVAQGDYGATGWRDKVAAMPQSPPSPSALLPTELMWSTARALALDIPDAALAARIEAMFAALGLSSVALSPLHTLSGGKRQLVGLALALIREPALLLLDEPTSALDLHWRMVVLDLVRERLAQRGGVAIAALHDIDLAARYCDRLALLSQGRIVAAGRPAEVLTPETLAAVFQVEAEIVARPGGGILVHIVRPLPRALHRHG
ncbi:ABC transporter ATP-binding protein [Oceanibaculum pacificum]|uniref:Cobalamin/Fe3+-siderophores ABC transporter ATP-binding protein n=1 Tax=Oceanibaculum pacificum TaxID=580166 RepID=A0A154VSB0_9PROT|nr:ABC transporter ATP-binding protein [Oceanibaculum pacificum]KZD04111.1 cobalamin/Fe3+-siderophores ABC transporter ATP-binding protein [Oceanibaculum pacificum]